MSAVEPAPTDGSSQATAADRESRVTKPLPFTEASLARAIKGVERAGRFVIGVKPDGSLIVGDKQINSSSFVPDPELDTPASKWEDNKGV